MKKVTLKYGPDTPPNRPEPNRNTENPTRPHTKITWYAMAVFGCLFIAQLSFMLYYAGSQPDLKTADSHTILEKAPSKEPLSELEKSPVSAQFLP